MAEWTARTAMLYGEDNIEKLKNSGVAVFGVGGVGSFAAEALARTSIGHLVLVDSDGVDVTNINRQIPATSNTVGQQKTAVLKERFLSINPSINCETFDIFFDEENGEKFFIEHIVKNGIGYVVDAIDSLRSKVHLICLAKKHDIKIISSMGTGFKVDPSRLCLKDVFDTSNCPLARRLRKELRNKNIDSLLTVFSDEIPKENLAGASVPASAIFVPGSAGLMMASAVVNDITGMDKRF